MQDASAAAMHGFVAAASPGADDWAPPRLVRACDKLARPGYNSMTANEYIDEPAVLAAKVALLARLLQQGERCVAYTGAGISTASGIQDYASRATDSVGLRKARTGLDAEPTLTHRVLTSLHAAGNLHHWVQQNHDGLPQKAGFPPEHLNEIHGAWFDPSNPVVPMSGTLRSDLFASLQKWRKEADLCLALGTSLCGMNADSVVTDCAKRCRKGKGLGAVIVGLQQTVHDEQCSLRIFGRMDEVFGLLAEHMQLPVGTGTYQPRVPRGSQESPDVFLVPFGPDGAPGELHRWDLRQGQKMRVTAGPGEGFEGEIAGKTADGHYRVVLPVIREGAKDHGTGRVAYLLGSWWVQSAAAGTCKRLPLVNVRARRSAPAEPAAPATRTRPAELSRQVPPQTTTGYALPAEPAAPSAAPETIQVRVGNTCAPKDGRFRWTCYVKHGAGARVDMRRVTFRLHPTFAQNVIEVTEAPFEVSATGWGTFAIQILIDTPAGRYRCKHELSFDDADCSAIVTAKRTASAGQ